MALRGVLFYEKVVKSVVNPSGLLPPLLLMAYKHFLGFHTAVKFHLGILKLDVGIGVQCDADVRMSHDVLQCFGVHSALCHVGAESVSAHMGGDFRKLYFVNAVVLV